MIRGGALVKMVPTGFNVWHAGQWIKTALSENIEHSPMEKHYSVKGDQLDMLPESSTIHTNVYGQVRGYSRGYTPHIILLRPNAYWQ